MAKRKKASKGRGRPAPPIGVLERTTRTGRDVRRKARSLEQRELDVLGLVAIAVGVYLGLVLYLDWDGGSVGSAIADGLRIAFGLGAYVVPCLLVAVGGGAIARPVMAAIRSPGGGLIALFAGVSLALAAETAGLGGSGSRLGSDFFDRSFIEQHGGGFGELLYWASVTLFQRPGAHVLAVLLLVTGVVLVTGATISTILAGAGRATRTALTSARATATTATEPAETEIDESQTTLGGELWDGPPEPEDEEPTISIAEDLDETQETGDAALLEPVQHELTPMGKRKSGVTESDEHDYVPPAPKVLQVSEDTSGPDTRSQEAIAKTLLEALGHFRIEATLVGVVTGPRVSRYELRLAPGIKVQKVAALKNDLAYALASTEIRILAPIPGKQAVGVEVPNRRAQMVRLGDVYRGRPKGSSPLAAWLGKDISGKEIGADLAKMPHLLIAGTTGSGKSGCVNAILTSMLMHASPNEVRMVLIDPKRVELNHYDAIPHLLTPLVTNPRVAANVLGNLLAEMESRYALMQTVRARNLPELNRARRRAGEPPLPYIVCVIDELADLMMVSPAEVEDAIIRLAQKARAVGMHLVLATQSPRVQVITGLIKANVPSRIAFAVSSQVDSQVILDQGGAESLLGMGDMLFAPLGSSKLQRVQGAFVTEEEIARVTGHWAKQGTPEFDEELLVVPEKAAEGGVERDESFDDRVLEEAMRLVVEMNTASTSMFQRRLRFGYAKAGRLIDVLEQLGAVGPHEGSKPRQVLITAGDIPRIMGGGSGAVALAEEPPTDEDPGRSALGASSD